MIDLDNYEDQALLGGLRISQQLELIELLRSARELIKAQAVAFEALEYYNIETGSYDCQVDKCIEECSELTQALLKHRREKHDGQFRAANIRAELADVQLMVLQMQRLFGWAGSLEALAEKTERLERRIAK